MISAWNLKNVIVIAPTRYTAQYDLWEYATWNFWSVLPGFAKPLPVLDQTTPLLAFAAGGFAGERASGEVVTRIGEGGRAKSVRLPFSVCN